MSARRVTRSQSKTARPPPLEPGIPPLPRHADLAVRRQHNQTLPTRRRLPTDAAGHRAARNAFQQAADEADAVDLTRSGSGKEGSDEEEEDEDDEEAGGEDDEENDVDGDEGEEDGVEDEEAEDGEWSHKQAAAARRRSPSKRREQPTVPSSRSLLRQLLGFLWTVWKYSILVSLLALLAAPVALVLIQPHLLASPQLSSHSHSVLSTVRHALTSLTGLFRQPPSSAAIARSIHGSLPSVVDQLSQQQPAFAESLRRTIEPALDEHFDLSSHSSNRPLVVFIAHSPSIPVSALQSFASDLSSHLYPLDVPSYLLDLTDIAGQKHFDGRHLDTLLKQHFAAHNDGLVLLPALTALHHSRSVGETLQHWLDEDRSPAKRAVFVLGSAIELAAAKRTDVGDRLGGSREKHAVYERLRMAMQQGSGDGKNEDELIGAILNRLVRNVVMLK